MATLATIAPQHAPGSSGTILGQNHYGGQGRDERQKADCPEGRFQVTVNAAKQDHSRRRPKPSKVVQKTLNKVSVTFYANHTASLSASMRWTAWTAPCLIRRTAAQEHYASITEIVKRSKFDAKHLPPACRQDTPPSTYGLAKSSRKLHNTHAAGGPAYSNKLLTSRIERPGYLWLAAQQQQPGDA